MQISNGVRYTNFFRFFGIILFVYIIAKIDIPELAASFGQINLAYYFIGILFLFLSFLMRTIKWKKLINSIGTKIPDNILMQMMAKGLFLGVITPGRLGEFWRAKYLTDHSKVSHGFAFYTAFMDRLIDMLIFGLVAIAGLLTIYLRFGIEARWQMYLSAFIFFIAISFVFLKKLGLQGLFKIFVRFFVPVSKQEKTNVFLADFDGPFKGLKLRLFLELLAYGFLYYLTAVTVYYFVALSLGINLPFWYLFLTVSMVWLILALPLTFLGLGTREASFIYFFSLLGIPAHGAVAFSLSVLLIYILSALPGAILFLKQPSRNKI